MNMNCNRTPVKFTSFFTEMDTLFFCKSNYIQRYTQQTPKANLVIYQKIVKKAKPKWIDIKTTCNYE